MATTPQTNLAALLRKAAEALPPQHPSKGSYARFEPVVRQLLANEFNVSQAVDWLIEQKQIPAERRPSAYRSLRQLMHRRQKGGQP